MSATVACPHDGYALVPDVDRTYACVHCHRPWVVSITAAYDPGHFNPAAPFAPLVLAIDRIFNANVRNENRRRVA